MFEYNYSNYQTISLADAAGALLIEVGGVDHAGAPLAASYADGVGWFHVAK